MHQSWGKTGKTGCKTHGMRRDGEAGGCGDGYGRCPECAAAAPAPVSLGWMMSYQEAMRAREEAAPVATPSLLATAYQVGSWRVSYG